MHERMIEEYNSMKKGALITWPVLPATLGALAILFGEPKGQILFALGIFVTLSTAVCLPMFTYWAYKEGKLIKDNEQIEMKEFLQYKKEDNDGNKGN